MRLTSVRLADRTLPQLLRAARESGYFDVEYSRADRELRLGGDKLRLGQMLVENVRCKWRESTVAVSLNHLGLSPTGQSVLDLSKSKLAKHFGRIEASTKCDELPFELKEEFVSTTAVADRQKGVDRDEGDDRIAVRGDEYSSLSQLLFTRESQAECFMNVQRQRKIWWMKISANPGRIFATEVRKTENIHYTSLCSKFSFGNVEMEKIECISDDSVLSHKYPTIIRSTVALESATLAVVLDAIDAAVENELCLDRTIAPFQCGVLCRSSAKETDDLKDLTKYVQMLLTRSGISTYTYHDQLLSTDEANENQRIAQLDNMGVPYVLLLNSVSLKQGFLQLRNRDTTLCETIHISDVPAYLLDIFGHNAHK